MKKFKLHQKGIKALQQFLYALPDPKLAIEVRALRIDFKKWIKTKFELTINDLNLLNQLSVHFTEFAAIKFSNFLAQRIPISFAIIDFKPMTEPKISRYEEFKI